MPTEPKLLPCEECDSTDLETVIPDESLGQIIFYCRCKDCGYFAPGRTLERAVAHWNQRSAPSPSPGAPAEWMRKAGREILEYVNDCLTHKPIAIGLRTKHVVEILAKHVAAIIDAGLAEVKGALESLITEAERMTEIARTERGDGSIESHKAFQAINAAMVALAKLS